MRGIYEPIQRAEHIKATALDRHGTPITIETGGLLAVCIQHEIDHLCKGENHVLIKMLANEKGDF